MRANWKKGNVISLKIAENVYTLAQMANDSAKMRFFDIFHKNDVWENIDLNNVKELFCVAVGNIVIQKLGVRRIPDKKLIKSKLPCEGLFISPHMNPEGYRLRKEFIWKGGKLVDEGEDAIEAAYSATVIIENLNIKEHYDLIIKYELENMYGDIDIKERLLNYLNTGINIDSMKFKIFPGLEEVYRKNRTDIEKNSF